MIGRDTERTGRSLEKFKEEMGVEVEIIKLRKCRKEDIERLYENTLCLDCKHLTDVFLDKGINPLEYLDKIPMYFRWGDENLKSIKIPNNIKTIGTYAFYKCTNLEEVIIPDSVTSIEGGAFEDCFNLKDIVLPSNLTFIGEDSFKRCNNLTEIIVPDNVEEIHSGAFADCDNLKKIVFNDKITKLVSTCYLCNNLKEVVIGKGVEKMYDPFKYCDNLTDIYYNDSKESWDEIKKEDYEGNYIIPENIKIHFKEISKDMKKIEKMKRGEKFKDDSDNSYIYLDNGRAVNMETGEEKEFWKKLYFNMINKY